MRTVIIIPARFSSVRYPGKPLVKLSVGNGIQKSLIQLSWEAASRVKNVDEVFVATDDKRIRVEAESFGAKVIMTSKKCKNGTYPMMMLVKIERMATSWYDPVR